VIFFGGFEGVASFAEALSFVLDLITTASSAGMLDWDRFAVSRTLSSCPLAISRASKSFVETCEHAACALIAIDWEDAESGQVEAGGGSSRVFELESDESDADVAVNQVYHSAPRASSKPAHL
jgi:hypothetical protein